MKLYKKVLRVVFFPIYWALDVRKELILENVELFDSGAVKIYEELKAGKQ
jgi:uncharacterized protein YegL